MLETDAYSAYLQHPDDNTNNDDDNPDDNDDDQISQDDNDGNPIDPDKLPPHVDQPQSQPPSTDAYAQSSVFLPFSLPNPYIHSPYFLTPPNHNPYSPTGGQGHLHPPTISHNPPAAVAYDGQAIDQYINEDDDPLAPPPAKRRKHQVSPIDDADRPVEELFAEITEPNPPLSPNIESNSDTQDKPSKANIARFKCMVCDAKFPRKNAIVAHIKTHLGKKKYICSIDGCNMAFVREHDCKRHEATHTASRPHICACGRPFARPDALRRHRNRGHCGNPTTNNEGGETPAPPPANAKATGKWKGGRPSNIARAAAVNSSTNRSNSEDALDATETSATSHPTILSGTDVNRNTTIADPSLNTPASLVVNQLAFLNGLRQQYEQGVLRGAPPDWLLATPGSAASLDSGSRAIGTPTGSVPPISELVAAAAAATAHNFDALQGTGLGLGVANPDSNPVVTKSGRKSSNVSTASTASSSKAPKKGTKTGGAGTAKKGKKGAEAQQAPTVASHGPDQPDPVNVSQYYLPFVTPNMPVHSHNPAAAAAAANFLATLHPSLLPHLSLPTSSHNGQHSTSHPQTLPSAAGNTALDPSISNLVAIAVETATRQARAQAQAAAMQQHQQHQQEVQQNQQAEVDEAMVDGMDMDLSKYADVDPALTSPSEENANDGKAQGSSRASDRPHSDTPTTPSS